MSGAQCKRGAPGRRAGGFSIGRVGLLGVLLLGLSCAVRPRPPLVSVPALEAAHVVPPKNRQRAVVCDPSRLEDLLCPLGPRLALLQIRRPEHWTLLRQAAPGLRGTPDFAHGSVVGLVSRLGLPVDGRWPLTLETVRVLDGAGFVVGHFQGGNFLPDGSAYVEAAEIDGLTRVLMVEINATRFYPD